MKQWLVFIFTLVTSISMGQMDALEFASPVDHAIRLSGSFGELRTNHFHTGIDIKSRKGTSGDRVYAVADGCLSRVKIQAAGYGQALYIDHPNGLTSVYAHLDKMTEEISEWVRDQQYKLESFEVDLYPDSCQFAFSKREQVGHMGNTGYSFGPHLHFELRNTRTERAVNPTAYDFVIADRLRPQLRKLFIYTLDDGYRKQSAKEVKEGRLRRLNASDTLEVAAWRIGLGLDVIDQMDGTYNRNDVYKLEVFVDDTLAYGFVLDSLDFDETRYINAHRDYPAFSERRARIHQLFVLPGNLLSNYYRSGGVIDLYQSKPRLVKILATDHFQNTASIQFNVRRDPSMPGYANTFFHYELQYDEPNIIRENGLQITVPADALYNSGPLSVDILSDESEGIYSNTIYIDAHDMPLHKPMELWIAGRNITRELADKYYIAKCNGPETINTGGTWQDHGLVTTTRMTGQFMIKIDTTPPNLEVLRFPTQLKSGSTIRFKVTEEMDYSGQADGISYEAFVDDQWFLLKYDYKSDQLTGIMDVPLSAGEHTFNLTVTDHLGNSTHFTKDFIWSE